MFFKHMYNDNLCSYFLKYFYKNFNVNNVINNYKCIKPRFFNK